jgi:hypothetical protein
MRGGESGVNLPLRSLDCDHQNPEKGAAYHFPIRRNAMFFSGFGLHSINGRGFASRRKMIPRRPVGQTPTVTTIA